MSTNKSAKGRKGGKGDKGGKAKELDPVFEVQTPLSPTGITNAAPRPKSAPRTAPAGGFLAAEQFSYNMSGMEQSNPASLPRRRGRDTIGKFPEFVNLSGLNCTSSDFKQHNSCAAPPREQFALYEPDLSAFKPTSTSPIRARVPPKTRTPSRPKMPATVEKGIVEVREGCINPIVAKTKEAMPSREQVQGFTKTGQGRVFDCATRAYETYRESCAPGDHRGDDAEFFMNQQDGGNPQDGPDAPRAVSFEENEVKSRGRKATRDAMSTEDSIRSRNLRYPEASLVDNPVNSFAITDTNEKKALEEDATSILDMTPNEGDDPQSLRTYRLSLFQNDTDSHAVPRSRLSRALQELDHQDGTVGDLTEELLEARDSLSKTKKLLKENDTKTKKQQCAVTDLRAKFVTEKHHLHDRLQRESEENSKLQTKLSTLQVEVTRLRSNLRYAKTDLKKKSNKWADESRNEETSKSSGRSSMISADDTALVAALRSEVADLKNQLGEARMQENRTVMNNEYDSSDVLRLKSHLERAEVELRRLKDAQLLRPAADKQAVEDLKASLAKSEEALYLAAEKEKSLSVELEDTKAIIAALELSHRSRHNDSLAEVQALKVRLGRLESGAEEARQRANEELRECRMEAEELREEMVRLGQALAEETHRARVKGSERVKERMQHEYKLEESAEEGRSFQQKIQKLEESLAKAEEDALTRKGALVQVEQKAINQSIQSNQRSVKRKLDASGPTARDISTPERSVMLLQPMSLPVEPAVERLFDQRKREEEESILKAEVAALSDQLRRAEEIALKAKGDAMDRMEDAKVESAEKEREVNELKAQLIEQTKKSGETQKERELNQTELEKLRERELNVDSEMKALKSKLESAESKVEQEMFRAEEERRMAVETDTERVTEINRLREELELAKTEESSRASVDKLVSRIDLAERELEMYRMHSSSESDGEEIDPETALKNARALVENQGITALEDSSYYDAPSFISSSDSEVSSMDESHSTVPTSHMSSPLKAASVISLASTASPLSMSSAMGTTRMPAASLHFSSPRSGVGNRSVASSPSPFKVSPSRATSPLSPPRLKNLASPPSKGTSLPVLEEEVVSTFKFGRAGKNPARKSGIGPLKKSPTKRLDITDIQRRLLESNERLSAAKSKLKGLVDVSDENRAEQTRIKTSVDDILEIISKQTQRALASSAASGISSLRPSSIGVPRDVTPERINEHLSSDGSSAQRVDSSTYSHARRTMRSTEQVLERYRLYKAARHDMSPLRISAAIDQFISEEEGEI